MAAPRSMTVREVNEVARELQTWVGSQLQEVVIDGIKGEDPRSIRLGFFWTGGIRWIVLDYRVQAPLLMLFDGHDGVPMTPPKTAGKIRRPIELFLRSKHIGRRLREVRVRIEDGRALDLIFDPNVDGSEVSVELKVYPHGRNARAISGEQSVSEFKPMADAKNAQPVRAKSFDELEHPPRSNSELAHEWMEIVKPGSSVSRPLGREADAASPMKVQKSPHEKKLEKMRQALMKVTAEISSKESSPARSIGEWLKENQTLEVPREWPESWSSAVDGRKSLSWNIEKQFTTAKSQTRKLDGTRARARELEKDIATLEKKIHRGETRDEKLENAPKDLLVQADARGRKFQLSEDLIVYLGKNAAENLAILRKAQPFDYWLHLRDRPGAHAIMRRARGRNITDAEFIKAGIYVAEQTMKRRAIEMRGESFDLLIVECRFVRPIKGDKLGRVNYTHDRVVRLSL
ncbi:hypothetical protein BH10BDE1_BH10BDE1_00270 [soil metagenome]